ncbi:hypothetical protein B566_EDAN014722 [Ephemera danica]|nr:hypothetical protein B566_EDAN014722 [Ephemera danica]
MASNWALMEMVRTLHVTDTHPTWIQQVQDMLHAWSNNPLHHWDAVSPNAVIDDLQLLSRVHGETSESPNSLVHLFNVVVLLASQPR